MRLRVVFAALLLLLCLLGTSFALPVDSRSLTLSADGADGKRSAVVEGRSDGGDDDGDDDEDDGSGDDEPAHVMYDEDDGDSDADDGDGDMSDDDEGDDDDDDGEVDLPPLPPPVKVDPKLFDGGPVPHKVPEYKPETEDECLDCSEHVQGTLSRAKEAGVTDAELAPFMRRVCKDTFSTGAWGMPESFQAVALEKKCADAALPFAGAGYPDVNKLVSMSYAFCAKVRKCTPPEVTMRLRQHNNTRAARAHMVSLQVQAAAAETEASAARTKAATAEGSERKQLLDKAAAHQKIADTTNAKLSEHEEHTDKLHKMEKTPHVKRLNECIRKAVSFLAVASSHDVAGEEVHGYMDSLCRQLLHEQIAAEELSRPTVAQAHRMCGDAAALYSGEGYGSSDTARQFCRLVTTEPAPLVAGDNPAGDKQLWYSDQEISQMRLERKSKADAEESKQLEEEEHAKHLPPKELKLDDLVMEAPEEAADDLWDDAEPVPEPTEPHATGTTGGTGATGIFAGEPLNPLLPGDDDEEEPEPEPVLSEHDFNQIMGNMAEEVPYDSLVGDEAGEESSELPDNDGSAFL